MIKVQKEGVLFSNTDLAFENEGVCNPAVIRIGKYVHIFYRAIRKGNHSSIGYCRLNGPLTIDERWVKPVIIPESGYESQGVEDPRIVKIDDRYYLTYTAFDGINALGAVAVSDDLQLFKKRGIIVPRASFEELMLLLPDSNSLDRRYFMDHKFYYPDTDPDKEMKVWDKNVIFFPRRINGNLVFLHRLRPGIQLVSVKNLKELTKDYWTDYLQNLPDHIVLDPVSQYESLYIGGGCPPVETEHGWLLIYHGAEETGTGRVYSACAALLDINDPGKVIARLPYALFTPELEWETNGYVNNVVFPTGTALFGDTLYIYYGAADQRVACASVSLKELLSELLNYSLNAGNILSPRVFESIISQQIDMIDNETGHYPRNIKPNTQRTMNEDAGTETSEILFITSYPPRECGIATYSQDLIKAINNKFRNSFTIKVCALESDETSFLYPPEVKYILKTSNAIEYEKLALAINSDRHISIVLIQHEFGFFHSQDFAFLQFLLSITKPVIIVFHTVLPHPDEQLRLKVISIAAACASVVVMTHNSADILINEYGVIKQKISVIAHGTHLIPNLGKKYLKSKYGFTNRKVLTTFGLLSSGKNIETTLEALPAIISQCPEVVFLIIGKTHPEVVRTEGEKYRETLSQKVKKLRLQNHVQFINAYLPLSELLEYLQLTDIYLFTTNDPNQAVSGTFVYAMSCGCPIISTPIPHAREVLTKDTGIIFDFQNSQQLAEGVLRLLNDESLRRSISSNTLQKIVSTVWENSAIAHVKLLKKIVGDKITIRYSLPAINLHHMRLMTTKTGIIQFSKISQPDIRSGYTLDDNARALVTMCMYREISGNNKANHEIQKYLGFIKYCQQPAGDFLNYVDKDLMFTEQNSTVNLDDANGRAIWALGYLVSIKHLIPASLAEEAEVMLGNSMQHLITVSSTRAMAFAVKGLYYAYSADKNPVYLAVLKILANRLVQMYRHESGPAWEWFEDYLTYANSVLPEAMLYAWLITGGNVYREIAISSLNFLLSKTFNKNGIEVISNRGWQRKGQEAGRFGEQPIDVAYTIMTLNMFNKTFPDEGYLAYMSIAFNWFLGENRLHQIVYNPCTGGCYDGLEDTHVNLNQGSESTVSYLMARLTLEDSKGK